MKSASQNSSSANQTWITVYSLSGQVIDRVLINMPAIIYDNLSEHEQLHVMGYCYQGHDGCECVMGSMR